MGIKPGERFALRSRFFRPGVARPLVCLLVLLVALALAGRTRSAAAPPTQNTTPTTTVDLTPPPTPTPSPPDLALATKFAQNGQFDQAVGSYQAVIARGKPDGRGPARLGLARLYFDDGQFATAAHQLEAFLLEAPAGADVRDAQFLLAEALRHQGDWTGALPLYDAYIKAAGDAVTYARMGRAETLARLARVSEARAEADGLLNGAPLPVSIRRRLILAMAQGLEQTSPSDAQAAYDRLRQESSSRTDQALAMWHSAQLSGAAGNQYSAWVTIMRSYPDTPTALQIVDQPPAIKSLAPVIDPYYPGLVYYYGSEDGKARTLFQQVIDDGGDNASRASFYLGVLDERDGATDNAITEYGNVVKLDPKSSLADDALWWQGRLLEQAGRTAEAQAAYKTLISGYSGSSLAGEARFRLALVAYDAGQAKEAASAFAAIAKATRGLEQQRAQLWQGKALAAGGDDRGAKAVWGGLEKSTPDGYYGLRAAVLLGDAKGALKDANAQRARTPDWQAIERWLSAAKGADPVLARQAVLADPHWLPANTLLRLGLQREADAEFGLMLDNASGDAGLLLELARSFYDLGEHQLAARAAASVLNQVPDETARQAPDDLWRVAYPAPFGEALRTAADYERVPDILLLALVRQESFFDPIAGSPAGALGLTQVIFSTGEAIAQQLRVSGFENGDLYRPALSLRFGAHYLREQLDTFDGDIYAALAAYNGGPGNALRWQRAAHGDVDRFVAEVDLTETTTYVRLVAENLARYRQLYQGLDQPALPKN